MSQITLRVARIQLQDQAQAVSLRYGRRLSACATMAFKKDLDCKNVGDGKAIRRRQFRGLKIPKNFVARVLSAIKTLRISIGLGSLAGGRHEQIWNELFHIEVPQFGIVDCNDKRILIPLSISSLFFLYFLQALRSFQFPKIRVTAKNETAF